MLDGKAETTAVRARTESPPDALRVDDDGQAGRDHLLHEHEPNAPSVLMAVAGVSSIVLGSAWGWPLIGRLL